MDTALRRSVVVLLMGVAIAPCFGSARTRRPCDGRFYVVEEPGGAPSRRSGGALLGPSFAAVAWNYVMECTGVVDVQSVLDSTAQHRNHGGEDICAQGAFD
jgi:hypothetical protein